MRERRTGGHARKALQVRRDKEMEPVIYQPWGFIGMIIQRFVKVHKLEKGNTRKRENERCVAREDETAKVVSSLTALEKMRPMMQAGEIILSPAA